MFRQESINVPVLGLIENMAYFTPEELPENKYYIFGKNGVKTCLKISMHAFWEKFRWFRASGNLEI